MARTLQAIKQRFGIIGTSSLLDHALNTAVRVAPTDLSVLVVGESGVGKEVFSKVIHFLSPRKHSQFIAINCGALPSGTINSELFGHEKGAFTGASSDRKGYFETVNGGTIFLDEIAEMPLDTQVFLLRILESGEFMKVGSNKVLKSDIRVLAATNVDLEDRVAKGKFREDLFYRLNTVMIKVPALRERTDDIPILFRKFASDFADKYRTTSVRLDEKAQLVLENYTWKGNIRELKNVAERVSLMSEEKIITAEQLIDSNPHLLQRNLPAKTNPGNNGNSNFEEREILYKLLFEMKADLNDLKSLVFEMIKRNDLKVPDLRDLRRLEAPSFSKSEQRDSFTEDSERLFSSSNTPYQDSSMDYNEHDSQPIIIENPNYEHVEEIMETLSLEAMEKQMIDKALKKYKGRRKEAAEELGISERTLYRKIKQYEL
ncbi:sigma-54 dependent transcriptional regulator [Saprospiraceae bacterium]|jgi:DNA-binding NtrC family response regulator|nr:sigma-54 dependent transcriptional regulator [Saprospiraceae bacterium]MDC3210597.1 sigma-54 dependent transcriptional regulator [Saprospiraceae bacterium]MDC3219472.1 sigma-54 dependent transcriptional regulator [Saprospiraceae bacterium]MDG1434096.1 sigma-54 dependent transcriptional regulator [Saprospiraceae bacterium]